jgi:hypothetical protein
MSELESTPSESTPAADQVDAAPATQEPAAEPTSQAPDYSYVPAKFLNEDGSPDFEKLSKSYGNLEKRLGAKPNIPAGSIDEYEFNFGEGFDLNEDRAVSFKNAALEKGFTKDQYDLVMDTYMQMLNETTWTVEKTETALKQEWGNDFENQVQSVRRAFNEFAPSDASPHDPVWNHPQVVKLLARMGAEIGEDSVAGKGGTQGGAQLTDEEVTKIMQSSEYRKGDRALHDKVTKHFQHKK